jgi:tRNA modification GTPase
MVLDETIVALSTPAGAGERAILRLSGPRAVEIADQVFTFEVLGGMATLLRGHAAPGAPLTAASTFTAHAGRLNVAGLSVPTTAYLMRAPRSYTRQDVVEFHVGAWPALAGDLVAGLVAAGARPAQPGEFTFRALASGRLDLAQAEAVMALIGAADRLTLRAAADLLAGHLSREIERLSGQVRQALALVEVGLDFSDSGLDIIPPEEIAARIEAAGAALADLGRRARGLETFSGRVRLVIAGRPNAGKSSLFNRLLAADRAIVSPEAGTTRDELRSALHIGGLEFALSDIAGVEGAVPVSRRCETGTAPLGAPKEAVPAPASDDIAALARQKALAAIGAADLVLVAIDATSPTFEGTDEVLALAAAPVVVAITKCDLAPPDRALEYLEGAVPVSRKGAVPISRRCEMGTAPLESEAKEPPEATGTVPFSKRPEKGTVPLIVVATSAATGQGLDPLGRALVRAVVGGSVDRQAAGPVVTARHRAGLEQAAGALARAARLARAAAPQPELVAVELRETLDALGAILGRHADPDVLGTIFAQFCIGK